MRAKYLYQWMPPIIEHELKEVTIKKILSEHEKDMLKDELGVMMFGDEYNPILGNAEMPSRMAGELGSKVKEWKDTIEEKIVLKSQDEN